VDIVAERQAIRTIVVDDSPVALRAICSLVERQRNLSFVGAATNGREAVALARALRPDLILLDLEMPIMDGVEATSYLSRDCPATRVVVVTVHDTPELRKLCYERGASGFIGKDVLNDQLPVVIAKLFGNSDREGLWGCG
jgi:two-component system nitrate/nitrite response regulator NarL